MKTILLFILLLPAISFSREKLPEKVKSELQSVFEANEQLHQLFFDYEKSKKKLKPQAEVVSKKIALISDKKIKGLLTYSQKKLAEIGDDKTKNQNNQNYHLVSMALIHILSKYEVGGDFNAYSCPMVKKKWVQNSARKTKVMNPYAPEMPHCGSKDSKY